MAVTIAELTQLDTAIERGTRRLLELQRPDGVWVGELESNVTMTAQHLFWHHYLDLRTPELDRRIANDLLARMRDDGTWSIWFEGPADLSTTIEAYVACRIAGVDPGPRTLAYIRREGGIPKSRLFTKCFMALLGQWPWQRMAPIPPELVLVPPGSPFSIYDFSCWARQTFVALSVAQSLRPVRPADVDLTAIGARPGKTRPPGRPNRLRRRAVTVAERWIRERQEADGSWGGIQPPWVWGIIALAALGNGLDDPTLGKAVEGWQGFMVDDGERLRPEACQSPVWDTALAALALRACGVPADHEALRRPGDYLLREEVTVKGDWSIRKPDLAPGGWAFEFENDLYPDVDDTAVVLLALHKADALDGPTRKRAVDWMLAMQSRNGGWAAFDKDNTSRLPALLRFSDFGEMIDPPSADVTGHVVETLGVFGLDQKHPAVARGLRYLYAKQENEGSWFGRWGVNHLYGIGAVLPALAAAGEPMDSLAVRRAVRWLGERQNPDGGWGETCASYVDVQARGRGESAPSQTAWALMGLVAAGRADSTAAHRGAQFLIDRQRTDGAWDEESFTGCGFPGYGIGEEEGARIHEGHELAAGFMIRYHLYRNCFPLLALGRYRRALQLSTRPAPEQGGDACNRKSSISAISMR